ncbi:MAG: FAD:protein FMN transferase, partial [Oscillospiraceae bacterium]|nr:FAD:protein FMN transferase [Oscillospiraceae bacterium]
PATGYPAKSGLKSVTIVAESSALADALSTACFVLGLEDGAALLKKYPGCEGIFITDADTLFITSGLSGAVQMSDERLEMSVLTESGS